MKSLDFFLLEGKKAIVTGAARGLGRQHAIALAEAGADVAVCDLLEEGEKVADEIRELGRNSLFMRVDVSDSANIKEFIELVVGKLLGIDILVNNAARVSEGCPLEEVDDGLWREIIDINLGGAFYFSKQVFPWMAKNGGGSIINIASINSFVISNIAPRHNVAYCVAKAGLMQLTKGMAAEWVQYNIRVNAIAPGYILTAQTSATAKSPEILSRNIENTPMKRYGEVEELKGAIIFLASQASSFMTGATVVIDGGYTVW